MRDPLLMPARVRVHTLLSALSGRVVPLVLGAAGMALLVATFLPWLGYAVTDHPTGWALARVHGLVFDLSEEQDSSGPAFTGLWTVVTGLVLVITAIRLGTNRRAPGDRVEDLVIGGAIAVAVVTATWMFALDFNYYTPLTPGLAVWLIAAWVACITWSYARHLRLRTILSVATFASLLIYWATASEANYEQLSGGGATGVALVVWLLYGLWRLVGAVARGVRRRRAAR